MAITHIKLAIALPKAILLAITVASKAMCLVNVRKPRKNDHAISVAKRAICLVNVQKAGTAVVGEVHRVRNVTSAVK